MKFRHRQPKNTEIHNLWHNPHELKSTLIYGGVKIKGMCTATLPHVYVALLLPEHERTNLLSYHSCLSH